MQTLAQKYPDAITMLQQNGYFALAELCRRHHRQTDMAAALGFCSSSAVSKWLTKEHMPLRRVEEKALEALGEQRVRQKEFTFSAPAPEPAPKPAPAPEPAPTPDDNMLMVVCPAGSSAKVQRVLVMLGCEVEVI